MRLTGVVLLVALLAMGGGYLWLRSWLHSEDFRRMLSEEAGEALAAEARFADFRWDGTTVETDAFDADGEALVERVRARGLSINIGLGRVRERVVQLRQAEVHDIEAVLDLREEAGLGQADDGAGEETEADAPGWYERFLPNEVELTGLEIGRSAVRLRMEDGDTVFAGTRWEVTPDQGGYAISGGGGRLTTPWAFVPELELGEARLRYRDQTVFLTSSDFRLYERGVLRLLGEASLEGRGFAFEGEIRDVRAGELLEPDWRQRLSGRVASDFTVANDGEDVAVSGRVELLDGVLTGLPVLDALGAYGGDPRFRRLTLSEARVDFRREDGALALTDLRLGSEGLMRVEGSLRVDAEDRLEGRFRLGLVPGTLARIPGAETRVFRPGERGLLWVPVRVTGTLDEPREDLSRRLIAAAGERMFEVLPGSGERVLKYTDRVIDEDFAGRVLGADGVIRRGEDLVEKGSGLLDGEGDVIREAEDVVREGEDMVREVKGIFDAFRGREPEEEEPRRAE